MLEYEIVPQEDTVSVTVSEDGKSETLTLMAPPPESSVLVQRNRKDVLGEINLEKMLANLDDCVDLLQITFNAVDGFKVQSQVQELSKQFSDAMVKSNATALAFKMATEQVTECYIEAYGNLCYGETATAIDIISDIKPVAVKMVEKSEELVQVYDSLAKRTNDILKAVMDERAADEEKRKETKALVAELDASVKALNQVKENLQNDIKQFEEEYKKLEEREIKQENRAFAMELTSAILGGIGGIFSNITEGISSSQKKQERDEAEKSVEGEQPESSAEENAKQEYSKNIMEQEEKKSQIKKLEERIAAIDKVLDGELYKGGKNHKTTKDTDDEEQKEQESSEKENAEEKAVDVEEADTLKTADELRSEKKQKVNEKSKLEKELKSLESTEKTLSESLKSFGVAVDQLSGEVRDMAQNTLKQSESLAARMDNIQKERNRLKDMERENTVKLAEYTAKMENAVIEENSLESAIQSLVIAIGCLRRVLAYLQEIKLFWMNVEAFCDSLANNNSLEKMIRRQEGKDPERSAAYFKTKLFVKGYLEVVAKWQCLHLIFSQYLEALSGVASRLHTTFEQAISADRTKQWDLASELAGKLKDKLRLEVEE